MLSVWVLHRSKLAFCFSLYREGTRLREVKRPAWAPWTSILSLSVSNCLGSFLLFIYLKHTSALWPSVAPHYPWAKFIFLGLAFEDLTQATPAFPSCLISPPPQQAALAHGPEYPAHIWVPHAFAHPGPLCPQHPPLISMDLNRPPLPGSLPHGPTGKDLSFLWTVWCELCDEPCSSLSSWSPRYTAGTQWALVLLVIPRKQTYLCLLCGLQDQPVQTQGKDPARVLLPVNSSVSLLSCKFPSIFPDLSLSF